MKDPTVISFPDYASPMPEMFDAPDDTRLVAHVTVMGEPKAKGRPRFKVGQGAYTDPATRSAEGRVRAAFEAVDHPDYPKGGTFRLDVDFYLGTRRHVDVDNLMKLVKDALNGVAYEDDWRVFDERGRKWHTDNPRTELFLYLIPGDREEKDA